MADNRSNIDQQSSKINQNQSKINQEATKINQNSIRIRSWRGLGGHLGSCVAPGGDLISKPWFVGPPWAPELGAQSGPKSTQERAQKQSSWLTLLGSISEPSWGRFWFDLGVQNGAKIGPESVSRAIMKQMWKCLKNLGFHSVFGASDPETMIRWTLGVPELRSQSGPKSTQERAKNNHFG